MNIKILKIEDIEKILDFENRALEKNVADEVERKFAAWHSPWRQEALEHYLPQGWCFGIWQGAEGESDLLGYLLAQPILFFKGMTQSFWIEHISFLSQNVGQELITVAYKMSREKHMQKLLFSESEILLELTSNWQPVKVSTGLFEVKTAKIKC